MHDTVENVGMGELLLAFKQTPRSSIALPVGCSWQICRWRKSADKGKGQRLRSTGVDSLAGGLSSSCSSREASEDPITHTCRVRGDADGAVGVVIDPLAGTANTAISSD